jgi:hypothetical protein
MPSFPFCGSEGVFCFVEGLNCRTVASETNLTIQRFNRSPFTSALVSQPKTVPWLFAGTKMKDQYVKKISSWLALAGLFIVSKSSAVSFDDVQFWIGSGTNRAALVVEWSAPESLTNSTVPLPVADKTLVWGYRFNGTATGTQMLQAILEADPRLYVVASTTYGTFVEAIGYNLSGGVAAGLKDGASTNYFTDNFVTNATVDIDAATPLNPGDLYWGGYWGPNWETWTEAGDAGGLLTAPDRGTNAFWTSTDPDYYSSGFHGQWELSQAGLDALSLTNGSWVGLSVAAGEYESDTNAPYNAHKHAPSMPDPSITALVKNLVGGSQAGQWHARFLSCSNWSYSLERSTDLRDWTAILTNIAGNGSGIDLQDTNPPAGQSFYRVRADKP